MFFPKDGDTLISNLKDRIKNVALKKTKVLITDSSSLISVFILLEKRMIVTIDSDRMLRIWSLDNGEPQKTVLLKKLKDHKKAKLEYGCITSKEPY